MKTFDPNKFLQGKKRKPTVIVPAELDLHGYYVLFGHYIAETNYYNIRKIESIDSLPEKIDEDFFLRIKRRRLRSPLYNGIPIKNDTLGDLEMIGIFCGERSELPSVFCDPLNFIFGYSCKSELVFYEYQVDLPTMKTAANDFKPVVNKSLSRCNIETYQLKMDIFSRNTGILESDIMLKKGALIIGCGSVGSLVALELARAGVGRFYLVDMDILGYHNICRHQCGIQDVGKYKTTAVKERILQINPTAQVITAHKRIQDIPLDDFAKFCNEDTIVVGCADNREGDLYADSILAKQYKMPFVSIGCWERAFAGEIFYCLPEGMPAYKDFVAALGEGSGRSTANTHLYMGEVGTFEPGISVDINFVTTIAVKMILDLLNRNNDGYTQRLLPHLTQYTLICNTNNPKIGGDMAEIFSYPLQVTTSIEVEYAQEEKEKNG